MTKQSVHIWFGILTLVVGSFLYVGTFRDESEIVGGDVIDVKVSEKPKVETYFAQVDEKGNVKTIIVADQAFINSGAVGDPSSWVETKYDGTADPAYIGGKYDTAKSKFLTKEEVEGKVAKPLEVYVATTTP